MKLHLSVKERWFRQLASGEKANEYRDETPYYSDRLLAAPKSDGKPEEAAGWCKCSDGKWRKFRPYDTVVFHLSGDPQKTVELPLKAIDCERGKYVLRVR